MFTETRAKGVRRGNQISEAFNKLSAAIVARVNSDSREYTQRSEMHPVSYWQTLLN